MSQEEARSWWQASQLAFIDYEQQNIAYDFWIIGYRGNCGSRCVTMENEGVWGSPPLSLPLQNTKGLIFWPKVGVYTNFWRIIYLCQGFFEVLSIEIGNERVEMFADTLSTRSQRGLGAAKTSHFPGC